MRLQPILFGNSLELRGAPLTLSTRKVQRFMSPGRSSESTTIDILLLILDPRSAEHASYNCDCRGVKEDSSGSDCRKPNGRRGSGKQVRHQWHAWPIGGFASSVRLTTSHLGCRRSRRLVDGSPAGIRRCRVEARIQMRNGQILGAVPGSLLNNTTILLRIVPTRECIGFFNELVTATTTLAGDTKRRPFVMRRH
jgi:hypothetical protein